MRPDELYNSQQRATSSRLEVSRLQQFLGIARLVEIAKSSRTTVPFEREALASLVGELEQAQDHHRQEVYETLAALGAHLGNIGLEDVYLILQSEPLVVRQRVGTKFLWMRDQAARIAVGRHADLPFRCEIGERLFLHTNGTWQTRHPNDLEFWALLHFLPCLLLRDGRRWLPHSKREGHDAEPPDFDVYDLDTDSLVGVECSECIESGWARQLDAQCEVLREIQASLGNLALVIESAVDWRVLQEQLPALLDSLHEVSPHQKQGMRRSFDILVQDQRLRGTMARSDIPSFVTFARRGQVGNIADKIQAKQIIASLQTKNGKSNKLKRIPSVLLLYPNNDLVSPNMAEASKLASKLVSVEMQCRFSELWSLNRSGTEAFRIY